MNAIVLTDKLNAVAAPLPRPLLSIAEVSVRFGGVTAIESLSFTVSRGEFVSLLGPSGCGKSTLLKAIAGLVKVDAGAIRFCGREIGSLSEDETSEYLMRDVGFIYQDVQLMARTTALENASNADEFKLRMQGIASTADISRQSMQSAGFGR